MPLLHLAILALVQGLTEFLPVSSSGHLALAPRLMDWPDQGRAIDVAVHVGSLFAVLLYFRGDIARMLAGLARGGAGDPGRRLFLQIALASLPVVAAGYLVSRLPDGALRSVETIGWATLLFGVALGVADRAGASGRRVETAGYGAALAIGLAQVLALVPGASRSGVTMTAARALGFRRADAARFSMLLGIPAILGAGTLEGIGLWRAGGAAPWLDAALAAGIAFAAALAAIAAMMAWLRRAGFMPFVAYRVALGGALLAWAYL